MAQAYFQCPLCRITTRYDHPLTGAAPPRCQCPGKQPGRIEHAPVEMTFRGFGKAGQHNLPHGDPTAGEVK